MKLKQEFIVRNIGGESVLIPVMQQGDAFHGIISLNETGAFIWNCLEQEKSKEQIVAELQNEYEVTQEQAAHSVDEFCANLEKLGIL